MNLPHLRLASEALPEPTVTEGVLRQIDTLQAEIDSLRQEVNILRRRDETLNFYMHRLDEELRLAARLQQDFLPKSLPQLGAVRFHTLFRPAGYVSGDFYDVVRLDEQHLGFFVADAVGHGMPAALLTMFIKHALATKQIMPGGYRLLSPSETLSRLNAVLLEQGLSHGIYATALYGTINVKTHSISFARGGHPPPILLRDGNFASIETTGGLLGVFDDEQYFEHTCQLQSGDRLLVYTDGVEVAFSNDECPDGARWLDELRRRASMPSEQLLQEFASDIDRENGSLTPRDDMTMMIVEVS